MLSSNLIQLLVAVAPALPASFLDYGVEDIQWEVQAFPGGPLLNLTGTVEQAHDELVRLNPNFTDDFPFQPENSLQARTDFGGSSYNCNTNVWGLASKHEIENGISYLWHWKQCDIGNCGRVSCSGDAAIWWCNDARETKTLASFGSIADGAQFIVDRCTVQRGQWTTVASGQEFHQSSWNVIARQDSC
ncbi:hypothetical protein B0I35DRAFT_466520 [Stachybotrys elegans]|uniref:Uncharacterized protein n=1 Tax=Stachybotrys elegans TaxID=80388 RepID=A0A8K0WXI7_9HYPO|nr:hypothetical protein B0I35DRAFT_466520 [Stachybotrys elegans]